MLTELIPTIPIGINVFMSVQTVQIERPALRQASERLETASAEAIVRYALEMWGDKICVGTSFTDTVLVHLVTSVAPDVEVIFCDTGFHFAETLQTMKAAQARYQLNLTVVRPSTDAPDLWAAGSDACCAARKVDGLRNAMHEGGFDAWFSGLRRADSDSRTGVPIVGTDNRGVVKVNPLANWSDSDVEAYATKHHLISNPLVEQGYASVGCWPCTEPASPEDPRAGRWAGSTKTECGLHLD